MKPEKPDHRRTNDEDDLSMKSDPTPESPIKTICVEGLPNDVTYREMHNFLRVTCVGYECCHLSRQVHNGHVTVFARFKERPSAFDAIHRLHGFNVCLKKKME
jgi:hypothetical protein